MILTPAKIPITNCFNVSLPFMIIPFRHIVFVKKQALSITALPLYETLALCWSDTCYCLIHFFNVAAVLFAATCSANSKIELCFVLSLLFQFITKQVLLSFLDADIFPSTAFPVQLIVPQSDIFRQR